MLSQHQKQAFGEKGYVVVPGVVPQSLVDAARVEVAAQVARQPPPVGHRGPHLLFVTETLPDALCALLWDSLALGAAEALIQPGKFDASEHVQISLNIPPFNHRPGGPHIDGLTPPERDGRPGTFTLLAGILLTDQTEENMGNLWVWPGSHRAAAAYFRERGPEVLSTSAPYPPVELPEPCQVLGRAGDVLLAHYMLGHNIGGNMSGLPREAVYFRLRREGHRDRWRDCVRDPLLEFGPVRSAAGEEVDGMA
ncbi:MAG TPA: phytanoyl-CoA dioxygenase family protein [Armatimonadota bacterium]|nr:phytanoyl-CoA dioxygenase family protein [Armatimonadota bacterium]